MQVCDDDFLLNSRTDAKSLNRLPASFKIHFNFTE